MANILSNTDGGLITAERAGTLDTAGTKGGAEDDGADIWSVGASYTIGNNVIIADYGSASDSDGTDGIANTADDVDDYDVWRIGAMHMMSSMYSTNARNKVKISPFSREAYEIYKKQLGEHASSPAKPGEQDIKAVVEVLRDQLGGTVNVANE